MLTWKRASVLYASLYLFTFSGGAFLYSDLKVLKSPLQFLQSYFIAFHSCYFRYQELVTQYGVQRVDHECAVRFQEFFGDFLIPLVFPIFFHILIAILLFIYLGRLVTTSYSKVYLLFNLFILFLILMPLGGFIYLAIIVFLMEYRNPGIFAGEGGMGLGLLGGIEIVHLMFAIVIGLGIGWWMIISHSHRIDDTGLIK